jgi:hypothetical protein
VCVCVSVRRSVPLSRAVGAGGYTVFGPVTGRAALGGLTRDNGIEDESAILAQEAKGAVRAGASAARRERERGQCVVTDAGGLSQV